MTSNARSGYGITGAAGEFFVAAELSRRGVIATLTLKNTPLIDVIATNPERGLVANIQVKTRSKRNRQGWVLSKKVEEASPMPNLFYVLVNLEELDALPDYYIIPHADLAPYIARGHKEWLAGESKTGKPRRDSSIRSFKPETTDKQFGVQYKANWELLGVF